MKRHMIAGILLAALLGTSACSESGTKTSSSNLIQISSIHWDEVAAADGAAQVNNNSLIMMR